MLDEALAQVQSQWEWYRSRQTNEPLPVLHSFCTLDRRAYMLYEPLGVRPANNLILSENTAGPAIRQVDILHAESLWNSEVQPSEPGFQPNRAQQFCLFILCVNFLSAFANEFSLRLFGTNAYVSAISAVLLPVAVLMAGNARRCAQLSLARWWIAFGVWLAICAPFSVWKTGTLELLSAYYFRTFLLYFAVCACAVSARQLTKLMYTLSAGTGLIVIICFAFGAISDEGRFSVPSSVFSFLANANELALALLFGILILIYPFFRKPRSARLASLTLIPVAAVFMLKTGSRGVLLSLAAVLITAFLISRSKARLVALGFFLVIVAVIAVPSAIRHRLMYIAVTEGTSPVSHLGDPTARASQAEREDLLVDSIKMTLRHPVFGVGPGQFAAARWSQITARREWAHWLGTHNSYTQVSSEAGIPGLVFYVASIVLCLQMNYRVYRETASRQGLEDYAGLSFCMLLSTVMYSISTLFFNIAYTSYFPTIAGITSATYLALDRVTSGQPRTHASTNAATSNQ
jgi:O-antigen ligase